MFKKYAKEIAIRTLKPILNERIKDVTPDLCYTAIMENGEIWAHTPDEIKDESFGWLNKLGFLYDRFGDVITPELLLERWLKIERPEIYAVIIGTKINDEELGKNWFATQVAIFKKEFDDYREKNK